MQPATRLGGLRVVARKLQRNERQAVVKIENDRQDVAVELSYYHQRRDLMSGSHYEQIAWLRAELRDL